MATVASLQNFPGMCKESFPNDWFPGCEEVSTGTTLVALEFDGGVVIGADSRTSMVTFCLILASELFQLSSGHLGRQQGD